MVSGPLAGLRIIEMAGIGPTPFAGMMLADSGAEVTHVARPSSSAERLQRPKDILLRSRTVVEIDAKQPEDVERVRELAADADGLIEGFRPGVMERLGLGPEPLLAANPRLVYGRMTGWGQSGPYARSAGHDINYIALAGALHALGRDGQKPAAPLNIIADLGGGGMLLAFGMVSALLDAQRTGLGRILDCAMTDGSALMMSMVMSLSSQGRWRDKPGTNVIDGGAPFYDTYETANGNFVAVGAIEPRFYRILCQHVGVAEDPDFIDQMNEAAWPIVRSKLATIFKRRSRSQWCELLEYSDACFAPVLSLAEASLHSHNVARGTFTQTDGVLQPAPAPLFDNKKAVG